MKNILRWIIFFPGSFILAFLSTFPLHWLLYFSLSRYFQTYPEFPERCLSPFLASYIIQISSTRIAPSLKKQVSYFMLFFQLLLYILIAFPQVEQLLGLQMQNFSISMNFYTICGLAGMSLGFYMNYKNYIKKNEVDE